MSTTSTNSALRIVRRIGLLTIALAWFCAVSQAGPHYFGPIGMTGDTREGGIVVIKVEKDSPAEGHLKAGDTITHIQDRPLKGDTRRMMALAILEAESKVNSNGNLRMLVQADGDEGTRPVDLKVKVLGRYSDTAPFDCEKTDKLVTQTAEALVESGDYDDGLCVGWLALMATGEAKYLDLVKREMPKQDWFTPDPEAHDALIRGDTDMGLISWYMGYRLIAMAEYYLLTGDKSALPGIRTYALTLARGQDPAGLWGHRMATDKRNGRLPGYSHINQPSMTCFLGMILARKCGIQSPELDDAIALTHRFVRRFVGEGALPYGNHGPNTKTFNNNGSSAIAALNMTLLDDRDSARFFSEQSGASHQGIETGHATHYFNVLWTPLGVNVAGPAMTQRFFEKTKWLHTLSRSWNNQFTLDGGTMKAGSSTGSHLLAFCLPRQTLLITGRDADQSLWLDEAQADDVIGWSEFDYSAMTEDQLIDLIDHRAPQVKIPAVWTLRKRDPNFIPKFVSLLDTGNDSQKQSVLGFFGYKCPTKVAEPYIKRIAAVLRDKDEHPRVRAEAAKALSWHGELAHPYFNDMLQFVLEEKPGDTAGLSDYEASFALRQIGENAFAKGLVTDKSLLYDAAMKLADNPRQGVRAVGMQLLRGMPIEDFHVVADKVRHVVLNRDPDYTSYHNPQSSVEAAAAILSDMNIREGMAWIYQTLGTPDGKFAFKIKAVLRSLKPYGPHARPYVDKLKANPKTNRLDDGRFKHLWRDLVEASEQDATQAPELISFQQAKQIGMKH